MNNTEQTPDRSLSNLDETEPYPGWVGGPAHTFEHPVDADVPDCRCQQVGEVRD